MGRAGHEPLYSALIDRNKDMVAILLAAGADVKQPNGGGSLPIFAAVGSGQSDLVTMILDKGADVNAVDRSGATPIFAAIQAGQLDIVKLLVDRGVDGFEVGGGWGTHRMRFRVRRGNPRSETDPKQFRSIIKGRTARRGRPRRLQDRFPSGSVAFFTLV